MTDQARRSRNIAVAAVIGGFVLPLAGLVGAALFYAQGERELVWRVLVASVLGVVFYVLLFTG